ncbi:hypothetical protein TNCV_269801 [Trichonephila clavipes]|nr:hypothetical protein TNCV_269801 [Trichonephila clavipes]
MFRSGGQSNTNPQRLVSKKPEKKKEVPSSFNLLDTIMAGQKILHTKSENVVINTDGSLILKENKMKNKSLVKEHSTFEKSKTGENSKTYNTKLQNAVKANESPRDCKIKEKIATKKLDSFDKSKSFAPSESSSLGAIPKVQNKDSEKMSPMLLAALARRKENERANISVSNMKDKKRVSFSDEKKYFESEYISVEDNTELERENQNSSLECSKLQNYKIKSETDKRILENKKENDSVNLNSSCSLNSKLNFNPCDSHSFETKQSFKMEQSYSIDEKCVKRETGGKCLSRSIENVYSRIATFSDVNNIMDMNPSQSLLQADSNQSALLLNCTKNLHVNIKEEPNSTSSEESDLEESQSLISPFKTQQENLSSLFSSSIRPKNSEANIKEEFALTNNDYSINYLKKDFSVSKSNFQPVKSLQRVECPQSLIQTATDIDSTQRKKVTGKCIKKELLSSGVLNSNGCSKSANKLLDKQVKIKDEPPSSDDERRHMSPVAQFTNDLSNNRHTLRSHMQNFYLSHTKTSDVNSKIAEFTCDSNVLSCTQLAESSSNGLLKSPLFNYEVDDLPHTQLSSKVQLDNLPYTQLAEHHFQETFNDLSCTQLAEHCSEEQLANFLCTQLAENHFWKPSDDLPSTQLAKHSSKVQINSLPCTQLAENSSKEEMDDLPCTQLAGCSKEQLDNLPCTQLAEHHYRKNLDDLPCTQLAEHYSKEQPDNLLCTQLAEHCSKELTDDLPFTQLAEHCSKEQLNSLLCTQLTEPHFQKPLDDLPCTQLAEHHSKKKLDNLPCTQLAEYRSKELTDDLPCTQLAEHCSKEQPDNLTCTQLAEPHFQKLLDDLPCTQLAEHHSKKQLDNLPYMQLAEHHSKELTDDLPCTQSAGHSSKEQPDNLTCTQLAEPHFQKPLDDLPCTQLAEHHSKKKLDNLHCTQLTEHHSKELTDDLPCTQFCQLSETTKPLDDLPCTQLAEHHSKKKLDNLPCTQLTEHHSKELTDDLSCTQLAEHCSKEQLNSLPCTQLAEPRFQKPLDDLPCTQLAEHHSKKQPDNLPCTQLAKHRSKELTDDLPCTQLAEHCSNDQLDSLSCTKLTEHCFKELTDDLPCTQLAEHCSKGGADNLLHTQLAEHCSREQLDNLPHTQLSKQCPEGKLENLPHKLLSNDKVVPLQNNRDNHNKIPYNFESDLLESRSHTLDDSHSKLLKFLKEKSNDENFSEERETISALLLRSGNLEVKKSIKKIGGHKNLPQVLMHASLKHIPVLKPTNKKTFSFDQVKQYYGLKEDKETSNNNINKVNGFISPTCKSSIESSCILFSDKNLVKYDAGVDRNILKRDEKDNEEEIEIIPMNAENVKKEKEILEVVVSSDDEDFPRIQSHDIFSNKILDCSLKEQNQKSSVSFSCIPIKQEKVMENHLAYVNKKNICNKVEDSVALNGNINQIIKKETDGINFKEHSKTINSLNLSAFIKKEKEVCCEERKENVLEKNKIKSSLQLKSEKSIGKKIKHENKMGDAVESKDKSVKKEKHDSEKKASRNQDLTVSNDCNFLKEKQTRNDVEQNSFNIRRDKRKSEVGHYTNGKIQVEDKSLSMSELKKQDIAKEKNVSKRTYENKEKFITKNRTITESRKDKTIKNKEKYLGRDNEMMQSIEKHLGKDNKTISSKEKNDSKNKITRQSNSKNKLVGSGKLVTEKRKLSSMDVEKSSYNNKRHKMKWSEVSSKVRDNEKGHITKEKSDKGRKKSLDCSLNSRNNVITMKNNYEFEKIFKNIHEENMISKKDSAKLSLGKKYPSESVIPHSNEKKGAQESDHKLTSESIKNFKDVKNEKLLNSNISSTSFNALRTNLKKEPSNASNVLTVEREKAIMGTMKERRKSTFSESPSYSEDTCDSYNSPSMKSKVLTKKYPEKFKHQKNALTVLNQVADEIIAFSDKSKSHIFLDEPIDLDIIKKGCDPFKGRKSAILTVRCPQRYFHGDQRRI